MDPPLTPSLPAVTSAANLLTTESIVSPPNSRQTDSSDDSLPPDHLPPKIRIMCSHGGCIVPRAHDNSLFYVGGDTRILIVDRNIKLADLVFRIAKTLGLETEGFRLKYQLPNEDMDLLISLVVDEDVEVMINEYDRCKESRLRLFVFEVNLETNCLSVESLFDGSVKSDQWFMSALNGSRLLSRRFSDCLIGLGFDKELGDLRGKSVKSSDQDFNSSPDSNTLETVPLSDSMELIPDMAKLPPIRVRESGGRVRTQDWVHGEMPSSEVNALSQQTRVVDKIGSRVESYDEKTDHVVEAGVSKKPLQQQQKMASGAVGSSNPDLIRSDGFGGIPNANRRADQMRYQEVVRVPSGETRTSTYHVDETHNFRDAIDVQVQLQMPECGYMVQPNMERNQQPHHYSYPQQSVQYVIQQPGNPVPIPAYYPLYPPRQQAHHPRHQSIPVQQSLYPMYIVLPPPPPQDYNMMMQQAIYHEGTSAVHSSLPHAVPPIPNSAPESAMAVSICPNPPAVTFLNPEPVSAPIHETTTAGAQHMVPVTQNQFVTYSQANHPPHTMSTPTSAHIYEVQDPAGSQICFTQPPSPLLVSQYQSMPSTQSQALETSDQLQTTISSLLK